MRKFMVCIDNEDQINAVFRQPRVCFRALDSDDIGQPAFLTPLVHDIEHFLLNIDRVDLLDPARKAEREVTSTRPNVRYDA